MQLTFLLCSFRLASFKDGLFVEAGAADGIMISNSLHFELNRGWTGLLVEADPNTFQQLRSSNRNAWMIHTCLSTKPHPEVIDFDVAGMFGGIIHNGVKHSDTLVRSHVKIACR